MSLDSFRVRFEQAGSRLTAVEIVRAARSPIITSLHGTLLALGIVVSSYQARASTAHIVERLVVERSDGGSVEEQLGEATKAAILQLVSGHGEPAIPA